MMAALIGDLIEDRVTPGVANSAVRAGNSLLRVVELELRYGHQSSPSASKTFLLSQ